MAGYEALKKGNCKEPEPRSHGELPRDTHHRKITPKERRETLLNIQGRANSDTKSFGLFGSQEPRTSEIPDSEVSSSDTKRLSHFGSQKPRTSGIPDRAVSSRDLKTVIIAGKAQLVKVKLPSKQSYIRQDQSMETTWNLTSARIAATLCLAVESVPSARILYQQNLDRNVATSFWTNHPRIPFKA
jgi:hypothetical protein